MKYLFFGLLLLAVACNSPKDNAIATTDTINVNADLANIPPPHASAPVKVELVAEKPVLDSIETPHAVVKLLVNGQEVWQKQVTGGWNTFEKDQYASYKVPANASAAYQSWWAGSGDIFYLVQENGKWVVRSCEMGESEGEEEVTYAYKTEKEIPIQ